MIGVAEELALIFSLKFMEDLRQIEDVIYRKAGFGDGEVAGGSDTINKLL